QKSFTRFILLLSSLDVILVNAKAKEREKVAVDPTYDYNGIVRNMIRSWEAPVVYLRGRGFLPSDYQDTSKIKPSLDALMQRLEANNHAHEGIRTRNINGVSKAKKAFGWEQLQALSSKFKSKPDDRDGKQLPEKQMNANVAPAVKPKEPSSKRYDIILQRMIEKTRPNPGRQPSVSFQSAKALAPTNDNPGTSASVSLNSNGPLSFLPNPIDKSEMNMQKSNPSEAQETNVKEVTPDLKLGLAPTFLNWDMKNGRLNQYSPSEKEAYLNKLLNAYRKKLSSKETRNPSENPLEA
ncbi:hypothetical protein KR059_000809, partial [Drosophila kikkawai]